jgi:hypothetical protein
MGLFVSIGDGQMPNEVIELTTMTVKSAGFNPKQILALPEADRKPVVMGSIMGITSGLKFGEDTKTGRTYVALIGDFIAKNYNEPNRTYMGGKLFLPEGIHDRIVSATEGEGVLNAKGKPVYNQVEFAIEILVVPANNPQGYSYQGKALVEAKPSDPLQALLEKANAHQLALAAPKAEEAVATPATKPKK